MKVNSNIVMVVVLVVMGSLVVLANWTPTAVSTKVVEIKVIPTVFPVVSYKVDPIDRTNIRFDGLSSSTTKCVVKSYDWNFGDGDVGQGAVTSHTYDTAGIYTVTLTVANYSKEEASATTKVAIIP